MIIEQRDYSNRRDFVNYDTERLREEFLIQNIFLKDDIHLVYSLIDRIIVGGTMPVEKEVVLEGVEEFKAKTFLERREMGIINIGEKGKIVADGVEYTLNHFDCLYLPKGTKTVSFSSVDKEHPAKFYFNSTPAHKECKAKLITLEDAVHRHLGSKENCNERTINQFIIPDKVETCQLTMGLTHLEPGSIWNTMPCHTHDRRMEVYLYFDVEENEVVFHFMGTKDQTRHIIMHNEEAVISPSWSIHSGAGTKAYTFIWGMCGENQVFDDMDQIETTDLK